MSVLSNCLQHDSILHKQETFKNTYNKIVSLIYGKQRSIEAVIGGVCWIRRY